MFWFFACSLAYFTHMHFNAFTKHSTREKKSKKSAVIVPWHLCLQMLLNRSKREMQSKSALENFEHIKPVLVVRFFWWLCVCNVFLAKMIKSLQEWAGMRERAIWTCILSSSLLRCLPACLSLSACCCCLCVECIGMACKHTKYTYTSLLLVCVHISASSTNHRKRANFRQNNEYVSKRHFVKQVF